MRHVETSIKNENICDLFQPRVLGEQINIHVIEAVTEPKPDFDAMKQSIRNENI
jgi:hypothetical protein